MIINVAIDVKNLSDENQTTVEKSIDMSYAELRGAVKALKILVSGFEDSGVDPENLQMMGFSFEAENRDLYKYLQSREKEIESEFIKLKSESGIEMDQEDYCDMTSNVVSSALEMEHLKRIWRSSNPNMFRALCMALTTLLDGRPLTPLENNNEDWEKVDGHDNIFVHKRYHALQKHVYPDETIYYDNRRFKFYDVIRRQEFKGGPIVEYINRRFPIAFPYTPYGDPIKVYSKSFSTTGLVANYTDTIKILHAIFPNGIKKDMYDNFKMEGNELIKIDDDEYMDRLNEFNENRKRLKNIMNGDDENDSIASSDEA